MKFESLNVSGKVCASLGLESLNGNPAWKFEAAATRVARRSKAKDRARTRRGSQSSPQARVRKFGSLEFERSKVRKLQDFKVRKVSNVGGLKVSNFQ